MSFGVLCLVVVAAAGARAALSPAGENVCMFDEKYVDVVQIRELVPVKVYRVEWCWRIPPRCTVEDQVYKATVVNKELPRVRIVPKCCNGFKEIVEESRCVPICSEPCLNGTCTAPEKCSCESGYYGGRCDKACLPGTWGRGCLEKCDCHNSTCDGVHGDCICSPGWEGTRCEFPCGPGYYGQDCEESCNCDGGLCNHVSGDCEAITETTPVDYDLTTDASVFETTTVSDTEGTDPTTDATEASTEGVYTTPESVSTSVGTTSERNLYTHVTDVTAEWENTTVIIDEVVTSEPDVIRVVVGNTEETVPDHGNETEEDNEIEDSRDFSSGVQKQESNIVTLLENLSIICGVFVLIFVTIIIVVMFGNYRRARKIGFDFQKNGDIHSQEIPIHRFYGGTILPAKTILENHLSTTSLDLDTEQPKMMTFKPLPDEKQQDKEYFMKNNEISQGDFHDHSPKFRTIHDDYRNQLAQLGYDVPKSTTFAPNGFKYS